MKRLIHLLTCMISLIVVSSLAYAGDYSPPRLSLGLGGSIVYENFDTGIDDLTFDESSGLNAKVGYRISDNFALELDYLLIDGFKADMYGVEALELDGHVFTINAKLYPFTGPVQPYGLLGMGIADLEIKDTLGMGLSESESDTVLRAGAGVDILINRNLTFFTELSYYLTQGDIEDTDFLPLTAGIKITF